MVCKSKKSTMMTNRQPRILKVQTYRPPMTAGHRPNGHPRPELLYSHDHQQAEHHERMPTQETDAAEREEQQLLNITK
jgi:hypothetical protein